MIKLTKYAAKGGCACKIGPHILDTVLQQVKQIPHSNVLVDMTGSDDAGVYKLTEELALVQTLDFFTPIVDDPFTFGQITAANSLSDVYAMGGTPITAMNIVAFPVSLVKENVLTEVLNGAAAILEEANVSVVGGHSIENEVPLFGLSVTGTVDPRRIWQNKGACPGDVLILTKPIGTGVLSMALKGNIFVESGQAAIDSMKRLNKNAAMSAGQFTIHSCTDITGFSLLGHSAEMGRHSNCSIYIKAESIPLFESALEAAKMGLIPAATYGNRKAITDVHIDEKLDSVWSDICFDPQTSGGLLLSVSPGEGESLVQAIRENGDTNAAIIGTVGAADEYTVYIE